MKEILHLHSTSSQIISIRTPGILLKNFLEYSLILIQPNVLFILRQFQERRTKKRAYFDWNNQPMLLINQNEISQTKNTNSYTIFPNAEKNIDSKNLKFLL